MTYLPSVDKNVQSVNQRVKSLKQNNEDFEWYPTTDDMLQKIVSDLNLNARDGRRACSVLDIGAGDGKVLKYFKEHYDKTLDLYGIEISPTHVNNWDSNIIFMGADFHETNLASIDTSILFCNPIYSNYKNWVMNILLTGYFSVAYLVIPTRWQDDEDIKSIFDKRDLQYKVIYQSDFLNAERRARAKVDIVRVTTNSNSVDGKFSFYYKTQDPFNDWFDKTFPNLSDNKKQDEQDIANDHDNKNEVFKTKNNIYDMVAFYQKDYDRVMDNFMMLNNLEPALFKELNIDLKSIKETVKKRLLTLKNEHWHNFIEVYEPITNRLTKNYREKLYRNVIDRAESIPFNVDNAYIITEMAIKEADSYAEQQLKDFYDKLSNEKSVQTYKSNARVFKNSDKWRYRNEEAFTHYKLDYRIVQHRLLYTSAGAFDNRLPLRDVTSNINDICIIARIVGMPISVYEDGSSSIPLDLDFGDKIDITYHDPRTGKDEVLFAIKFFKNHNQHLFMSKEFAMRLNIAMAKIYGWVRNYEEAVQEMNIDDTQENKKIFDDVQVDNILCNVGAVKLLESR